MNTERFVGENAEELIWLRINRLRSVNLCEALLRKKFMMRNKCIDGELLSKKAIGLSSAIESTVGYWQSKGESLNSKVLSRYYALLQMTIAEQVSSIDNEDDLAGIQRHTEYGHGLATLRDDQSDFPFNYYVSILRSGHFYSYAKFLKCDTKQMDFVKRARSFEEVEEKDRLISLVDLFRRIPELQPVVREYLNCDPLSFHIVYSSRNMQIESANRRAKLQNNGELEVEAAVLSEAEKTTYLNLIPDSDAMDLKYVSNLGLPFSEIEEEVDTYSSEKLFVAKFRHKDDGYWHDYLNLYKSAYCGTSIIVPINGIIDDPILIHLMLLYTLSIIVRYLPDLWYEINSGKLDHIRSLIEYYLSIFDHVVPLLVLERITESNIRVDAPGGFFGPV